MREAALREQFESAEPTEAAPATEETKEGPGELQAGRRRVISARGPTTPDETRASGAATGGRRLPALFLDRRVRRQQQGGPHLPLRQGSGRGGQRQADVRELLPARESTCPTHETNMSRNCK